MYSWSISRMEMLSDK